MASKAKTVRIQWERCEHEAGAHADHCYSCAPFWERFPCAVDSADDGRKVWIVESCDVRAWPIVAYTHPLTAHAAMRGDVHASRVTGPIKLHRARPMIHAHGPQGDCSPRLCGAAASEWGDRDFATPEHVPSFGKACQACADLLRGEVST